MAVLAIAIIFLCLGSVSAADDAIDANLTADDNSLEVSELNEESNIDEISTADSVDVVNEENDDVLGAYEEDELDSTVYTTLTPVSDYTNVDGVITATVNVPIYVKMGGDYDNSYSAPSSSDTVHIRPSEYSYDDMLPSTTYGVATSDAGAPLTFTSTGTYTVLFKVSSYTWDIFSIDLPGANGNLTVKVGNKNYTGTLKDGKATVEITDLDAGNYTATVTYSGDETHKESSISAKFEVKAKTTPDANTTLNATVPQGSASPVFSIDLPGATGNLTVQIGNNTYTKELVNGSASIIVDDLAPGSYNATVTYSGDKNFAKISKNTTFTVPTPKLSGKNVNAVYSSGATYKVLVTADGKEVVGEKVVIKFNGKTYDVATDKNGYASLKLNTALKVNSYNIEVEFKGVKTTNKLTVKHLIKAKNLKIKKSKKVVKIR